MTQTINGMQAKQLGLDLAELHDGAWLESMRAHAKRISAECGMVTTDDLRLYGASYGLYPTDDLCSHCRNHPRMMHRRCCKTCLYRSSQRQQQRRRQAKRIAELEA